jgi:hypothetical protein
MDCPLEERASVEEFAHAIANSTIPDSCSVKNIDEHQYVGLGCSVV